MISKLAASPRPQQTEENTTEQPAENSQTTAPSPGITAPKSLPPSSNSPAPPARQKGAGGWIWFTLLCVLLAGTYFGWPWIRPVAVPWLEAHAGPLMDKLKPWFGESEAKNTKPRKRSVPVVAATVRRGDLDIYLNGLGTVTAFKTVTVRSRVEGELVNVAFEEGQMVKEGDLLAEIDPRPFQAILEQAEGTLARDEAMLKGANLTLERFKKLVSTNTVTAQQVDEQTALVRQAEGTVLTDRGLVSNAKLQLSYCQIHAPISGRIGLRLVDKGNIVRANDLTGLAVITQLQPIAVVFTIPQDDISRVQKHIVAGDEVPVEAFNRDFETRLATGKLLAIDNQVDPTTGTVRIKAVFENKDHMLFPNQFVNARMLVDVRRGAVIVPSAAVQHGPEFDFVYVVKTETDDQGETIHAVELRKVKSGPSEADDTMIDTGLEPGEQVVTDGIDKLQDKSLVSLGGPGGKKKGGGGAEPSKAAPVAPTQETPGSSTPAPEGGAPKAAGNTTKAAP